MKGLDNTLDVEPSTFRSAGYASTPLIEFGLWNYAAYVRMASVIVERFFDPVSDEIGSTVIPVVFSSFSIFAS